MTGAIAAWSRESPMLRRDCKSCQVYEYDEKTGQIMTYGQGQYLIRRRGQPPCHFGKCPKGHYRQPRVLNAVNRQAVNHWYECRAVGEWPKDATVRERAGLLLRLHEMTDRRKADELTTIMTQLAVRAI